MSEWDSTGPLFVVDDGPPAISFVAGSGQSNEAERRYMGRERGRTTMRFLRADPPGRGSRRRREGCVRTGR